MAKKTVYVGCSNPSISAQQLLNELLVKDSEGTVGLRTLEVSETAAEIVSVVGCPGTPQSIEQILRQIIALDPAGKPAIVLIKST